MRFCIGYGKEVFGKEWEGGFPDDGWIFKCCFVECPVWVQVRFYEHRLYSKFDVGGWVRRGFSDGCCEEEVSVVSARYADGCDDMGRVGWCIFVGRDGQDHAGRKDERLGVCCDVFAYEFRSNGGCDEWFIQHRFL